MSNPKSLNQSIKDEPTVVTSRNPLAYQKQNIKKHERIFHEFSAASETCHFSSQRYCWHKRKFSNLNTNQNSPSFERIRRKKK
jgi:hypothetical protein